ncbi:MAG: putative toxin-antitoxin system toxin component, PIN family [Pseudonocardia sp.]
MRAVLDPNVIVSAVLSRGGTPAVLLRAWLDGEYELVVSPALLDELERVLGYPKIVKRVGPSEARELLDMLRRHAELVEDPSCAPLVRSPDPDDDYLICLAQAATAVIVSGDADLLGLADRLPVYSPAGFLALLTST